MDETKITAFKGKRLMRSKIEIDESILEQVKQFNYLGCEMSLDGEPDFYKRINRFQEICGTIGQHLKKTRTDTQMKFYEVVARPTLLYGSETWVTTKRDMTRLEAAEMRFLRNVKVNTRLDKICKKRNHKRRTRDPWNTRCKNQIQTKLDQPP